jgi:hypothetical protein
MTRPTQERLRTALRQSAEAAPTVEVPPGLFLRARRRYRQRRALALLATVGIVALLVFGVYPRVDRAPAQPAQPAPPGLPTRLVHAPGFTAPLRRAPLDRAVAVFAGPGSGESVLFGDSFPLTVVGPADQYRVYQRPEWTSPSSAVPTFLLSPDGRSLLMSHSPSDGSSDPRTRVLDTRSGGTRELTGGAPLAWAPDGARAILVDGSVFRVVEVGTGRVDESVTVTAARSPGRVSAALSPDGTRLAIQLDDSVQLYQDGALLWRTEVTASWLAGAAAFTPAGDVAVFSVPDELHILAGTSGAPLTSQRYPSLPTMRADQPPTARLVAWRDGVPVVVTSNRVLLLSEPAAVLLTAPTDVGELEIATDTLLRPAATAGRPHPGPFLVRFGTLLKIGAVAVPLLILAAFLARRLRRRVRSARR